MSKHERERGRSHHSRWHRSGYALLALAAAASISGVDAADPEAGRDKAVGCIGCHTPDENSLAGKPAAALSQAMRSIRDGGDQSHPAVFGLLSDQDLEDIAAHFAELQR